MEHVTACPGCSSNQCVEVTSRGLDFVCERVMACQCCGLYFLSPRMDPQELAAYYAEEYSMRFRGNAIPSRQAMVARDQTAIYRTDVLRNWSVLRSGHTLLEVGCGAGNFLSQCRSLGVVASGIEPSRGYAESASKQGLDVLIGHFPGTQPDRTHYDVVAMFHVLEHLPDPLAVLTEVRGLLLPNGRLVVEVPDLDLALGVRWSERYFHRPHLFDFTRASLAHLLGRAGFEIIATNHCDSDRRRRHHLLVVARIADPDSGPSVDSTRARQSLRRLRRWIVLSRFSRPVVAGARRVVGWRHHKPD